MPRRHNRAILADIVNLGLDPKKNYTKVNKAGNLVGDLDSAKTKVRVELKQSQKVEEPKVEPKVEPTVEPTVELPISEVLSEELVAEHENILSTETIEEIVEEVKVEEIQVKTPQLPSGKKKKK
jgi:hypothetical protein